MNPQHIVSFILYSIALLVSLVSIVTDLKTRRILNVITYPGIVLGVLLTPLLYHLYQFSPLEGFLHALYGFLVGFGFFFFFYLLGKGKNMGAGDVKLMGALGALLGWEMTMNAIIFTAFTGLVIAIILFFPLLYLLVHSGNASSLKGYGKLTMPYGVSIGIGTIVAIVFRVLFVLDIIGMPIFL